ncbi:MAG: ATP-binding protein [Nitrospirae bacterium]|nr:ATP-binding protein [Nitrospirota bacterium]MDA1305368.1 ATP-binding protein [Nitrospirota bacterium]
MAPPSKLVPRLLPSSKLRKGVSQDEEQGAKAQHLHLKPVWIVLLLLIPCLLLTAYYARYGMTGSGLADSVLPSASYALVLFLVYLDVVGLVVLTLLLSRNLIKAYFERRHRLLGSGFRTKLIAAFIGFSLVPTLLLAFVASGVISEVMKVWFNDQIEQVLKDSEEMARMYHEGHMALATKSAHAISKEIFREDMLRPEHREILMAAMARKRAEFNLTGIEIFSSKLETLARMVDPDVPPSMMSLPVGQLVLQVLDTGKELTTVQEAPTGRLIRAAIPIFSGSNPEGIEGVVVVGTYVSEALLGKMEGIARQYTDFRQIKAMENPIKAGAYLFVAVVTVLLLFSATWFGFYVARGITVPIQKLAEGTEAVARGDLSVRISVNATDEIGTLVDSFNRMTADLSTSKAKLEEANQSLVQSNLEADRRRAYTEAVVETIASGVLSIDVHATITTFNHSAERILGVGADDVRGRPVFDVFKHSNFTLFQEAYDRILVDGRESLTLEGQMDVQGKLLTVGLNLSRMRNESGKDLGFVLVFEDRSELIKAQKTAAWQEVAQRIAHEIKNPLTPIQLAAQRLRKKFFDKAPDFEDIFDQSTSVIVSEVGSLKRMVDEFSKFARMPAPHMTRESLHEVIEDGVALYEGGHRDIEFHLSLDSSLPSLNIDREQMRRVFVNLFDNAIQAMEQKGRLWITTEVDWKLQRVVVKVVDEGPGIRHEDQEKLFLPYFSKRSAGTGLGLAIVHRIVTDHNGIIQVANHQPQGAIFTLELPIT